MGRSQEKPATRSPQTFRRSASLDAFLGEISSNASAAIRALLVIGADGLGRDLGRLLPDIVKLLEEPFPPDVQAALVHAYQRAAASAATQPYHPAAGVPAPAPTAPVEPVEHAAVMTVPGVQATPPVPELSLPEVPTPAPTNDDPFADIGFEVSD